ncbi:hypothetical protein QTO34_009649 [Cnephaeus nilssonii]|uniref:F-BAR domain-containing protein n=1 Tax=Cnephaeus nilssonii TaxID=3371016 RepID=A0AA40HI82_CNENI|nr:hypothetical protein QTO34_009649 [Eptesicus nilssonii]
MDIGLHVSTQVQMKLLLCILGASARGGGLQPAFCLNPLLPSGFCRCRQQAHTEPLTSRGQLRVNSQIAAEKRRPPGLERFPPALQPRGHRRQEQSRIRGTPACLSQTMWQAEHPELPSTRLVTNPPPSGGPKPGVLVTRQKAEQGEHHHGQLCDVPPPGHMPEQQLLKPTEWSYCDYFWADKKDPQGNGNVAGFELLLQKQLKGKQMQKEMSEFIRERIKIEEEYAKNLAKLSQNSLAAQEEGSLGEAWAQVKKSLADEAEVHLKFSAKLHSEVEKPLMNFRENFKKDMKKCDHHIADLRKQLASRYAAVEKARKALTERQRDLEMKTQQLEIKLSNKTEEDIKKARRKSTQAGDDLMRCVDLYNQAQSKWFEEMVTTTLELERLEVERVEMIRQHLCQYTQLRHETDMFNQSTVEPVDQLLRKVDPAKDRELWVREHKTGNIRPVDMEI